MNAYAWNAYTWIIVVSLVAAWCLDNLAALLSVRSLGRGGPEVAEFLPGDELARARDYAGANARLGLVSSAWSLALLLGAMFLGGFDLADRWVRELALHLGLPETLAGACFIGLLALASDIAHMPASLYATFIKEARFGFNRTTPSTWLKDRLKSWILSLVLGGALTWAVLAFFRALGPWAWIAAWGAVLLFLVFAHYLGPVLILPLFQKLTPLEPGPAREAVLDAAQRAGVAAADVMVMDGSRRSTKANAFFTGLGDKRRIVLFDTLLERHEPDEAAAILAHEAGHWKLRHVPLMFALSAIKAGFLLFMLSLFISAPGLHQAFGMERVTLHGGLVFFLVLATPLAMAMSLLLGSLSRRMEAAADRFSVRVMGGGEPLARALLRLGRDNLANPSPHPLAVALGHSHPPLAARIRILRSASPNP